MIGPQDRIFVAGHKGLVGRHLVAALKKNGFRQLLLQTHRELDLENQQAVQTFFHKAQPNIVFLAAAKVGGIAANDQQCADFIQANLQIQTHVIASAHAHNVERLVFLGSSCIYPRQAPQPIHEKDLLTGPLEPTNRSYAIAKIAGLEFIDALRRQYGRDYFSVQPCNLYGPGDFFDPNNGHVIPALITKVNQAIHTGHTELVIWGSGKPLREFMHAQDCADAIVYLADHIASSTLADYFAQSGAGSHINIGSGQEISIAQLAQLIARLMNFKGKLLFDRTKADGTPRKLLDSSFLKQLGWQPKFDLTEGLRQTIDWFQNQLAQQP